MDVGHGFQVSPGQCFSCGASGNEKLRADFGEVPSIRRTRMYVCDECVIAAAKKMADMGGNVVVLTTREAMELDEKADLYDEWRGRAEAAEGKLRDLASLVAEP